MFAASLSLYTLSLTLHSLESFDECTRDHYLEKASKRNPFGEKETPAKKFADFDVFTKVCVQHLGVMCISPSGLTKPQTDQSLTTAHTMDPDST